MVRARALSEFTAISILCFLSTAFHCCVITLAGAATIRRHSCLCPPIRMRSRAKPPDPRPPSNTPRTVTAMQTFKKRLFLEQLGQLAMAAPALHFASRTDVAEWQAKNNRDDSEPIHQGHRVLFDSTFRYGALIASPVPNTFTNDGNTAAI